MNLHFVDNGKIDAATRKAIRRHVMKGKNLGRTRRAPTREANRDAYVSVQEPATDFAESISSESSDGMQLETISVSRSIGDGFSFFTFPCSGGPKVGQQIQQFLAISAEDIYPEDFCLAADLGMSIWFECLLTDEALFHSVLAMSEVLVDALAGRRETSPAALHHLTKAYRHIGRGLHDCQTPSDSMTAAVMTMALHEDFAGQPGRSQVHIDALARMVELRGGLVQLDTHIVLLQKICRADIEYALHSGSYPRFSRDEFPRKMIQTMLYQFKPSEKSVSVALGIHVFDPSLRCVIADMMSACCLFNFGGNGFRLEPYAFQDILISVSYRLLHLCSPADSRLEDDYENACHLGLLAFMTTLLFRHGRSQRLSYKLLAKKLRNAIDTLSYNHIVEEATTLWLLLIGGISVLGAAAHRAWLLPRIRALLSKLHIDKWSVARDKIKTWPWIDTIHDGPGLELWLATVHI